MRTGLVWLLAIVAGVTLQSAACAQSAAFTDLPGDHYVIRQESRTENSSDSSSGSSRDVWTLEERVLATRDGGVELEFDLPADTPKEGRVRAWQYPARLFMPPGRAPEILNAPEMVARIGVWLGKDADKMCGRWIFTWTSQKIECDPQSVPEALETFQRPRDARAGGDHRETGARGSTRWKSEANASGGQTLTADFEIDPEIVRTTRAETDMALAEMMGKPAIARDVAMEAHASDRISGSISVRLEIDPAGRATRRTRVSQLEITGADGKTERTTTTETTEWKLVSRF